MIGSLPNPLPISGVGTGQVAHGLQLVFHLLDQLPTMKAEELDLPRFGISNLYPFLKSLACWPGAVECTVTTVYPKEVVLEFYLWRGYVPAGETYTLGFLFTREQLKVRV